MKTKKRINQDTPAEKFFLFLTGLVLVIFAICCVYPFWYVLIYSLSSADKVREGLSFLPKGFTLENYRKVFELKQIYHAIIISGLRAVIGTIVTLFCTSMLAYIVSKPQFKARKFIFRMMVFTMYVGGGLIPYILTMRAYHLDNTFLLYIIPSAFGAYNAILIKTYIEQLPAGLEESAMLDGANYFQIFIKIVIPLCVPVLAAVAVFTAVGQWNSWTDNFYLVRDPDLQCLQLILMNYLKQSEAVVKALQQGFSYDEIKNMVQISPMTIRMTVTVVSVVPIFCVYPFMQKYFVKGLLLGAIKG